MRFLDRPASIEFSLTSYCVQNTNKRSALRITRESELLGGQLIAYHTRESLVLEANFLREDLPYFTELLGEVVSQTKYSSNIANSY
jgi:ubiquinol-cytochrome c reductase core subunit 2